MVKIRLRRMGAKKNPFYRIVVADSKSPRDGRCIEEIGTYDPLKQPAEISFNRERVDYWISRGAQPTDTVRALIKKYDNPALAAEKPGGKKKKKSSGVAQIVSTEAAPAAPASEASEAPAADIPADAEKTEAPAADIPADAEKTEAPAADAPADAAEVKEETPADAGKSED